MSISVRHGPAVAHVQTVAQAAELMGLLCVAQRTKSESVPGLFAAADGLNHIRAALLQDVSAALDTTPQGIGQAARGLRSILGNGLTKKLQRIDAACAELRHFTSSGMSDIRSQVQEKLRVQPREFSQSPVRFDLDCADGRAAEEEFFPCQFPRPLASSRFLSELKETCSARRWSALAGGSLRQDRDRAQLLAGIYGLRRLSFGHQSG